VSTLSSSSTLAEIQASYDDNASYAEDDSTAKAAAFVTACRILLRVIAKASVQGGRGGFELHTDPESLRSEMAAANRWRSLRQTTGGVRHTSLENFRD